MNPNDISVIVRSCGRPLLLRRALASIVAQTRPPAEIVVVAIGDAGAKAVPDLKNLPALKLIPTDAVRSRGGALNDGIAAASGRWIAFLDDDDTWIANFLERAAPVLAAGHSNGSFGGVVTQAWVVEEKMKGHEIVERHRRLFNGTFHAVDLAALVVRNRFTLNAMVVRRDVWAAIGPYREDLPVLEDWEFNVRAAARFHFEVIPEALVCYHLRPVDDVAANTSVSEHQKVLAQIRNEWLRADLAAGRIGMGQLALLAETRGLDALLEFGRHCRARFHRWFGGPSR